MPFALDSIAARIIGALLIVALIGFGLYRYGHWMYDNGQRDERAQWQTWQVSQAQHVGDTIKSMEDSARSKEAKNAQDTAKTVSDLTKGLQNVESKNTALKSQLADANQRLRDPGYTNSPASCDSTAGTATASTPGSDGTAPGELSREASDFLFDLTADANKVALRLAACQQIVIKDRELCGEVGEAVK